MFQRAKRKEIIQWMILALSLIAGREDLRPDRNFMSVRNAFLLRNT